MTHKPEIMPAISREIWELKYRYKPAGDGAVPLKPRLTMANGGRTPAPAPRTPGGDETIADTFRRVANAAASAEAKGDRRRWAAQFLDIMSGFEFLPAGRILAGAGTERAVTLFNCFVMGRDRRRHGLDFREREGGRPHHAAGRRHRPRLLHAAAQGRAGARRGRGRLRAGELHDVWDAMCRTIMSAGSRRGAMMGDAGLRSPGHRAVHRRQARRRRAAECSTSRCW